MFLPMSPNSQKRPYTPVDPNPWSEPRSDDWIVTAVKFDVGRGVRSRRPPNFDMVLVVKDRQHPFSHSVDPQPQPGPTVPESSVGSRVKLVGEHAGIVNCGIRTRFPSVRRSSLIFGPLAVVFHHQRVPAHLKQRKIRNLRTFLPPERQKIHGRLNF